MGRVLSRIFLPIMGGRGKRHKGLKEGATRYVKSAVTGSLPLWAGREANILEQHEEMPRVSWRWHKSEMLIEGHGAIVLCMYGKCAYADDIGNLKRTTKRIEQKPATNSAPLHVRADREPGENEQWDRMARHSLYDTLWRLGVLHFSRDNRVEPDDLVTTERHIGVRRI